MVACTANVNAEIERECLKSGFDKVILSPLK